MQLKLTHRTVKTLTPQAKPFEAVDTDLKGFLIRIQPSGAMTYYYSYRNKEGKRQRYRIGDFGSLTVTQARDIAERCAGQVSNGNDIHQLKKENRRLHKAKMSNTLGHFIEKHYKPWVLAERKSDLDTLKRLALNFEQWYDLPFEDFNLSHLEQWCLKQREKGKQSTTLNRDIATLRSVLSKAIDWEVIEEHPLKKWKPLKVDRKPKVRYLTKDEETRLREALKTRDQQLKQQRNNANLWRTERDYEPLPSLDDYVFSDHLTPMILLSMNTGMRRGEVFNLYWHDVNFDQVLLTVDASHAKSSKTRHIALNKEAVFVLKAWRKLLRSLQPDSLLVFPNQDGKPFTDVKKSWQKLLKSANIKSFRWHDLRHHFASKLVMRGVDLNTVRELLGHADLTMTLRYAHLAPEHKAKAVALLVDEV